MKSLSPVTGGPAELHNMDFIMVMGRTGAGKTTFINIVSGSDFAVGDDLYSCTKEMNFSRPVPYMMSRDSLEERRVVFIDTPGLADTRMSQEELFHDVTALLVSLYEAGNRLVAVIYMFDVNTPKMSLSDVIDIEMFREMVGRDAMKNVVIATNKWDDLASHERGERRVQQFLSDQNFFRELCEGGASVWHLKRKEDPRKLVEDILRRNMPVTLQIQREVVDENKSLIDTAAGSVIGRDLDRKTQEVQSRLGKLKQDKQRDEQNQQIEDNDGGAKKTNHPSVTLDKSDPAERARRKRNAEIRSCEELGAEIQQAEARMNRNGQQLQASSPGKKAAVLIGGLVIAAGLAYVGSMVAGDMLGTISKPEVASSIAGGAIFVKKLQERKYQY